MRRIGIALAAAVALALPATAKTARAKAEVTCQDGTTSKAGRGACSHHGGVLKPEKSDAVEPSTGAPTRQPRGKAKAQERPDDEAREPKSGKTRADKGGGILGGLFGRRSERSSPRSTTRDEKGGSPTARCKDGTVSYSKHHSGTCSNHGGVQEWLDR